MCIYLMKNQPEEVKKRFSACYYGDVVISAITLAELEYGVEVSLHKKENEQALTQLLEDLVVLPFDQDAAKAYASIRAGTPKGKSDALDKLIASHARSLGVTLVTNNIKDFQRYPGITLENWVEI
jgi:tRNA(fMet)-specific endonuclease VapC